MIKNRNSLGGKSANDEMITFCKSLWTETHYASITNCVWIKRKEVERKLLRLSRSR